MDPSTQPETPPTSWLNRSVWGFGLASFFSDAGHEAATAALPALLTAVGASPAALGLIEGVADGFASVAKLAGGWIADRPARRKPVAVVGYLVTGLSTGACALASAWPQVLGARSLGWLARGVRGPARDAMLADAVPVGARGRAFGFHRAMDTMGAVAGPALATLVLTVASLRAVFWWSLVPGLLAAFAFAVMVKRDGSTAGKPQRFWQSVGALPSVFRRFLAAVLLFGMGDFARTLLILRASQLLAPTMGVSGAAAAAIILYIGHNLLYAAASYPVGWLADRVNPQRLLVGGYALGTLTAVLAAFATPTLWVLGLLFATAGLTLAFEDTLEGTIASLDVPKALWGTGYGVLATTNGIGDLVSSSLVGLLLARFGPTAGFGFAAVLCLAGTLVLASSGLGGPRRGWPER